MLGPLLRCVMDSPQYEYLPDGAEGSSESDSASGSVLHVQVGELLGQGAFSSVYLGRVVESGDLIAVKRFPMKVRRGMSILEGPVPCPVS